MSTSILSKRIIPYRFIHLLDLFINIYIIIINNLYIQWCASKAIKKIRVSSVPPRPFSSTRTLVDLEEKKKKIIRSRV